MTTLLWGGRFSAPPDARLLAFGSSYDDDLALANADIRASLAHVDTLAGARLIAPDEADALRAALGVVAEELDRASFAPNGPFEDIHSAIEARVVQLAGETIGGKLHAGRSRNDQVATAIALYARDALDKLSADSVALARELLARATQELQARTLLIGMTHWQPAQPILLAFWLHAAAVGVARQAARLLTARKAIARSPLGASALAGTSLPLDRTTAAKALGFELGPTENALDTVGDRDAALETLFACAALATYLSRLAEEFVIWCSPLVGFARLGDEAATGSSLMPQKKNPDVFELVRAKAATVDAYLGAALAQLKGLPLSYQRDLQETKRMLIAGVADTSAMLGAFRRAFASLEFDRDRCNASASAGFAIATELADRLVRAGVPFRSAHRLVGEFVRVAEAEGRGLDATDVSKCFSAAAEAFGTKMPAGSEAGFDAEACVSAKATAGSTNPALLASAIDATQHSLDSLAAGETA